MKPLFFSLLCILILLQFTTISAQVSSEDSTSLRSIDETKPSVYYGPVFGNTPISNLGHYAVTVTDPKVFQLSAGLSVLNTLRGQAPGLSLSAEAPDATGSFRTGNPVYVIDGLAFSTIDHYNMNAFEYQRISVINSGNAAARYGSAGLNSVVTLQRKTGEGFARPTFDLMSYTTFASNTMAETDYAFRTEPVDRWLFTNGIAYTQDFGNVDTRVSYTYSRFPSADGFRSETDIHTTSINTGLKLGERFTARLILDQFAKLTTADESPDYSPRLTDNIEGEETFLQGNLSLNYQILDGVKLSSQAAISRIKDQHTRHYGYLDFETLRVDRAYDHQQRSFVNFFLTGAHDLSKDNGFKLNYAAGYQIEKSNPYQSYSTEAAPAYFSSYSFSRTIDTKSILAELGFTYRDYLSLAMNYQNNNFHENDDNNTYTVASAFIFTNAFQWTSNAFTMGKIRVDYGAADVVNNIAYPLDFGNDNNYLPARGSGTNFETGIDLAFLSGKISLSVSRYYNYNDNLVAITSVDGDPANLRMVDVGSTTTEGWEVIAGAQIISNSTIQWSTKLNWRKFEKNFDAAPFYSGSFETASEWDGGWLNTVNVKRFFFNILLDTRHNVPTVDIDLADGGMVFYTEKDGSQTILRDLSVGYNMHGDKLQGSLLKGLRVSLTARNLVRLQGNTDDDIESTMFNYTLLRNFSLNIGATF